MKKILVAVLFILLLSGCASKGQPVLLQGQPTSSGASASSDSVILLSRTGGLAGKPASWTIYPDGRIVMADGKEVTVDAAQTTALFTSIDTLGYFNLPDYQAKPGKCRDCFNYSLSVTQNGQTKTITVIQGEADTPADVNKVLEAVTNFINQLPSN